MNKPIASATKIFSLLGSNDMRCVQTTAVSFFSPENLSSPPAAPPLRKHMPSPDHLRMNILLIPTPVSFFPLAPFLFLAAQKEEAGWVGDEGNTPFNVAPGVITQLISSSQLQRGEWGSHFTIQSPCSLKEEKWPATFSGLFPIWDSLVATVILFSHMISMGMLFSKYLSLNGSWFYLNDF